jgi:fumarate hydratase subunit alpha
LREIETQLIKQKTKELLLNVSFHLSPDVKKSLEEFKTKETTSTGKEILEIILENVELASKKEVAICQDTGMCVVFLEIGQEVVLKGDFIESAINEAVKEAYEEGYLRKSIVKDPLNRVNTNDNTPAIIHYTIVEGDQVKLSVMPKGFGSENMGAIKMLKPSDGVEGVIDFVIETVKNAGPNPCPPIIVGIGIGGTMEKATLLSKKALLRKLDDKHENPYYENLEKELLEKINNLGIGPQGLGGKTTALGVKIETYPTHIAGLPVAINITCHASRHKEIII